jgi:hypothetical protein
MVSSRETQTGDDIGVLSLSIKEREFPDRLSKCLSNGRGTWQTKTTTLRAVVSCLV